MKWQIRKPRLIRLDKSLWEYRWLSVKAFIKLLGLIADTTLRALDKVMPRPVAAIIVLWMLFDFFLVWRLT
jgi:hypothetical protein